jgi:phosphonate transport system substrate-binding protein
MLWPVHNSRGEELGISELRVGITAVTVKKELELNQKLFSLIGEKLGLPIKIVYPKTYNDMSILLKNEAVDIAYVCGLPYALDHDEFGLELLAAPVFRGKPLYQSYLIVPRDSPARSLKDLRGKVFTFSDPLSNSGSLVPTYNLSRMGEIPDTFFKKYFFSYSHANSIEAVAVNLADGANVDSYVYELVKIVNPKLAAKTRIIGKSGFMPITPLVMRASLPDRLKTRLKAVFFSLHQQSDGQEVLKFLALDKFVEAKDSDYDSIRGMYRAVPPIRKTAAK